MEKKKRGLLKKTISGIVATTAIAGAGLGITDKGIPMYIERKLNTPQYLTMLKEEVKSGATKEIEKEMLKPRIRNIFLHLLSPKDMPDYVKKAVEYEIDNNFNNGRIKFKVESPSSSTEFLKKGLGAYEVKATYQDYPFVSFNISKNNKGEYEPSSLKINPKNAFANRLEAVAKGAAKEKIFRNSNRKFGWFFILTSFFFLSSKVTGFTIATQSQNTTSLIGLILFSFGILLILIFRNK